MAKNSWDVSHLCRVLYNIRSLSPVAESCDAAAASAADSAETFEGRVAVCFAKNVSHRHCLAGHWKTQ